jgi:hypothetical protein
VLNILLFLVDIIEQHTIWIYAACALVILYYLRVYLLARQARLGTIFTIEREVAAHREGEAMSGIGTMLGLIVVVIGLKYYVMPTIDVTELAEPTPTVTLMPVAATTREPTPTPTPEATPTTPPTRRPAPPTQVIVPTEAPTATSAPPPACPDPNIRITSPGMGSVVSGQVAIQGTANHGQFQFYKVELGVGPDPSNWSVINDIHRSPVANGVLERFNTQAVPNGVYSLRLVVVDQTGNFPPPCRVQVTVQN